MASAAVLWYLIDADDAEALQVAVCEFDYREAQARREKEDYRRRWEEAHAEKTRLYELGFVGGILSRRGAARRGAAPGDPFWITGSTASKAWTTTRPGNRYRAVTGEPPASPSQVGNYKIATPQRGLLLTE